MRHADRDSVIIAKHTMYHLRSYNSMTCRDRDLRRPESRTIHLGKVSHRRWHETGNTLQSREGDWVAFASLVERVRVQIIELWSTNGIVDAELVLGRSSLQYFNQLNLAAGDSAVPGERVVLLLSNEHDEEVQEFAELRHFFRVSHRVPAVGDDDIPNILREICIVHFFTPVHEIKVKAKHRHAKDLQKAKARLTSPLIKTRKSRYVSFATGDGPRTDRIPMVASVVRRSRFWLDSTQTGVFPCFYADL